MDPTTVAGSRSEGTRKVIKPIARSFWASSPYPQDVDSFGAEKGQDEAEKASQGSFDHPVQQPMSSSSAPSWKSFEKVRHTSEEPKISGESIFLASTTLAGCSYLRLFGDPKGVWIQESSTPRLSKLGKIRPDSGPDRRRQLLLFTFDIATLAMNPLLTSR
eukprot:GHVS01099337.1.p1 GENE.GHVS01099337.1~~GHVS01099337.1.p1  ORF type:complete len:161 (-),score=3.71 GHVS01099337.1:199-681(-)